MLLRLFLLPFVLLLVLSEVSVQAQSNRDSLFSLLKANPHDTTKIDIYVSLYKALHADDITQAAEHIRQAIMLSEKIDDKKRSAIAYIKLARCYDQKGDLPEALNALVKAEKQFKYFHDTALEAEFFMMRGIIYYYEGTYDLAVKDLWKARSCYELLGDSVTVASCYLIIGVANMELKNLDNALEYYQKSLEIYKSMENEKGMGMAMGNMGVVYKIKKDYDKALDFYKQSLQINEKYGYKEDALIDIKNIGSLHAEKGDFQTALEFHKKAKGIAESVGSQIHILEANYNLAFVEYKLGHHQKAIHAFDKIIEAAKAINYKVIIKDTYKTLSDIYQEIGEFPLALDTRKEYEMWKDSLINENHLNQVKELEIKYETEKKDKQITLLAKEKELQVKEAERQAALNKASLSGLILVSILAALLIYIFRQQLRHQKLLTAKQQEVKEATFRQQMSELEVKALRAQINPHFLFNCMNSINRMILNSETENASRYLTKFSKLVRMILESTEASRVSLADELIMLETYIQLEALRFKDKINYKIIVDESIESEHTCLPSMVLQPFVENAIWHGLMHKEDAGMITIAIREEEDRLLCTIEDNGVGRAKARVLQEKSIVKQKSLGVKLTEDRLRLLSKEHLEELIRITDVRDALDQVQGTRVDIMVPIA